MPDTDDAPGGSEGSRRSGTRGSSRAPRGTRRTSPPRDAAEALARARDHGRNALAEGLRAARALLDAAALAAGGVPADTQRGLAPLARALDEASELLATERGQLSGELIDAILEALDQEIARWEGRSRDDPDARAVLRAFLGLREILWEFGLRPRDTEEREGDGEDDASGPASSPVRMQKTGGRSGRARVQRVRVQG